MVRVLRRIERLEEELMSAPEGPSETMTVRFVGAGMKVVSTLEFQMAQVRPPKRRWGPRRGGGAGDETRNATGGESGGARGTGLARLRALLKR